QVLLLLLRGAGQEDRQAAERVRAEVRGRPGARPSELLGDQGERETAHVRPAVFLRHPDAEEAGVDERAHRLRRVALGLVVVRGGRGGGGRGARRTRAGARGRGRGSARGRAARRAGRRAGGAPARGRRARRPPGAAARPRAPQAPPGGPATTPPTPRLTPVVGI